MKGGRKVNRKFTIHPLIQAVVIGVVQLATMYYIQSVFAITTPEVLSVIMGMILIIVLGIFGIVSSNKHRVESVPTKRNMIAIGAGVGLIALGMVLAGLTGARAFVATNESINWIMLGYVVIGAPIIEEVIFRQTLYGNYNKATLGIPTPTNIIVLVVLALLFILLHLPSTLPAFLYYACSAIGLSTAYVYSGNNVYVSLIVHMLNNLVTALFLINGVILVTI